MKKTSALSPIAPLILVAFSLGFGGRGDLFLSVSGLMDPTFLEEPSIGGQVGLELGVNDRTDLFAALTSVHAMNSFTEDGPISQRFVLGSWYSPYFGEIRPRIGGFAGFVYSDVPVVGKVMSMDIGFALQALWQFTDGIGFHAAISPNFLLGSSEDIDGGFSLPISVGLQFRLGK